MMYNPTSKQFYITSGERPAKDTCAKETDIPVEIQKLFTEQMKKRRKRKSVVVSVPETGELLSGIFTRDTDGNKE